MLNDCIGPTQMSDKQSTLDELLSTMLYLIKEPMIKIMLSHRRGSSWFEIGPVKYSTLGQHQFNILQRTVLRLANNLVNRLG